MQKKQYMDQRSISPILESSAYDDKEGYLNRGEKDTLTMFNQLFIDSSKLAADDDESDDSRSEDEGNGGQGKEGPTGGCTESTVQDDANDGASEVDDDNGDENKENCDPNHADSISTHEPIVRGRPSSCVFVASLCSSKSDDELCVSVTKHFGKWGKLSTVKVLRDPANRPYAFVQYNNDDDSKTAILNGHNSILHGRNLRCEAAKVNRTLFISSKFLKTEKAFRDAFQEFGEIEQLTVSDELGNFKLSKYQTKSSRFWFCKYVYRDDAIRAFANLSENSSFHIEWAQNIETFGSNKTYNNNHNAYKHEENKMKFDKFSVFVGQLNSSVSEEELTIRFKRHGKIEEVTIIKKTSNTFGFVRYKEESSAASAVERENHSMFKDRTMHVQYREVHSNTMKHSPKLHGVALAPPPINLKKRTSLGVKKHSDLRKMSPFNHQLYPMPIPIPTKKNFNNHPPNQNKTRTVSNTYSSSIGRRRISKFGDVYDKLRPEIKEDSPTPPESVQTYDSHTITRSGYSPSSAVNSERSEYVNSGGSNKNQKNLNTKKKNVPYFYYIPTNEVAPSSSSGYYNPYQYFIPYDASPEYQSQNGYGIPFPMYYPPTNNDQEFNFEDSFETPN